MDNQELTSKELDFAIEYMKHMEPWVSEMLQRLRDGNIETKRQLTTTQQKLDAAAEALKLCLKDYRSLSRISKEQGWKETQKDVAESIEYIEAALASIKEQA